MSFSLRVLERHSPKGLTENSRNVKIFVQTEYGCNIKDKTLKLF